MNFDIELTCWTISSVLLALFSFWTSLLKQGRILFPITGKKLPQKQKYWNHVRNGLAVALIFRVVVSFTCTQARYAGSTMPFYFNLGDTNMRKRFSIKQTIPIATSLERDAVLPLSEPHFVLVSAFELRTVIEKAAAIFPDKHSWCFWEDVKNVKCK